MNKVFKIQDLENGEWRDYTLQQLGGCLGMILPPPRHSVFSGIQGFLVFSKDNLWQIKTSDKKSLSVLIDYDFSQWNVLKHILSSKLLVDTMFHKKIYRQLLLDGICMCMFDILSKYDCEVAKVIYQNLTNDTKTIGKTFKRLFKQSIINNYNDYTLITAQLDSYNINFLPEYIEAIDFDLKDFNFDYNKKYMKDEIIKRYIFENEQHDLTVQVKPFDWLCGMYNNELVCFIQHNKMTGALSNSLPIYDSVDYVVTVNDEIYDLYELFFKDEDIYLISKPIFATDDEFMEQIKSLVLTLNLTKFRLLMNEFDCRMFDNRF